MGLRLTLDELNAEATHSQKKAIARLTGYGEVAISEAELWWRGVLCIVLDNNRRSTFTITPRGKTEEIK